jgi:hypothetical protein
MLQVVEKEKDGGVSSAWDKGETVAVEVQESVTGKGSWDKRRI